MSRRRLRFFIAVWFQSPQKVEEERKERKDGEKIVWIVARFSFVSSFPNCWVRKMVKITIDNTHRC